MPSLPLPAMSPSQLLEVCSRDDFNVHRAVSYLKLFSHSIGITYYLVARLAQFPEQEVEFYWPQLCHLLITSVGDSGALEGFVVKKCDESLHLAMLTLWQLQASLTDLSSNPSTPQFAVCRRVYNRVQHIIFSDAVLESTADAQSARQHLSPGQGAVQAVVAGLAVLLAAVSMPHLSSSVGKVAVEEGKRSRLTGPTGGNAVQSPVNTPDLGYDNSESEDDHPTVQPQASTSHTNGSTALRRSQRHARASSSDLAAPTSPTASPSKPGRLNRSKTISNKSQSDPSYIPGAPLLRATDSYVMSPRTPLSAASYNRSRQRNSSNPTGRKSTDLAKLHKVGHSYSMTCLPSPTANTSAQVQATATDIDDINIARDAKVTFSSPTPKDRYIDRPLVRTPPIGTLPYHSPDASTRLSLNNARNARSSPSLNHPYAASTSALQSGHQYSHSIPPKVLSTMLRSYACRSQLDLLTGLQDIATRLVAVPKMARLSALRAELTMLNHGLPRGCCLNMACSGLGGGGVAHTANASLRIDSETIFTAQSDKHRSHPHHRIVRISPSESVVLNSADRAPFLIHVEILEDDLDFDPSRRQNAEDVRSVLSERDGKPRNRSEAIAQGQSDLVRSRSPGIPPAPEYGRLGTSPSLTPTTPITDPPTRELNGHFRIPNGVSEIGDSSAVFFTATDSNQPQASAAKEEVDLVEQLYGDLSIHDANAIALPDYHQQIHNRDEDEAAWRRAEARKSFNLASGQTLTAALGQSKSTNSASSNSSSKALTVDEYAERMRMAAIMLAQLTASQQLPSSSTEVVTGVVGAGLALPLNITYGVGSLVGSVMGVGMDAMRSSFGGGRRDTASSIAEAISKSSSEQASSGVSTDLDLTTAASGTYAMTDPTVSSGSTLTAVPASLGDRQNAVASSSNMSPSSSSLLPHQRPRVLSPQEAAAIRERIMNEMMGLEEERMARVRVASSRYRFNSGRDQRKEAHYGAMQESSKEEKSIVMRAVNKEDPSGAVFQESWADKKSRIRAASPYGHLASWDVLSVIVKTGADLRQEQLAVQIIKEFGRVWTETKCPHWIRYFRILVTSESTGLLETITDAVSVHSIKKEAYVKMTSQMATGTQINGAAPSGYLPAFTLYDHFLEYFGEPTSLSFRRAQDAFCKSLASYSIICYLLQIKDRHNGNILVDKAGHVMHIDFGFMLSNSPGSLGFEMAPFKLTQDYIDILGGMGSPKWEEFRNLLRIQFREIRRHADRIVTMVEMMQTSSKLPCFNSGEATSQHLRDRFQLNLNSTQVDDFVDRLVISSAGSAFTRLYDTFQRHSQGVL